MFEEPTPFEALQDARQASGLGGRWYGVYPALVLDNKDVDGQGRVKVMLSWAPDTGEQRYEAWARLATLMGGLNRGSWFIPDVNDEVLVTFEGGDPRHPYVIGGLWNGQDTPPESMDEAGLNNLKVLRSRSGVKITLDDSEGLETLTLETPVGQQIKLQDGANTIELSDATGNTVTLGPEGITVSSTVKVTVNASMIEMTTSMLTVNAAMSKFSGVVQSDVVLTNSVVSSAYTPGAGNIW